ncbi:hypothetical protein [Halosolutus gelatinilyticus]|uniref:hypothetical protein n=1 Tax=Halosolutus gelatinilyticus TaxID=2931975 RepID=UPI001FF6C0A2|nr:hypothetical protein [Halosolutus gelatinilyticus]
MTGSDENARFLAACAECGSVYAALEHGDGDIVPIGKPDGCTCGGTTFSKVTDDSNSNPASTDEPDRLCDDSSETPG